MIDILSIKKCGRPKDHFKVYTSELEGEPLIVHEETVFKHSFTSGQQWHCDQWNQILWEDERLRCRAAVWRLLSDRPQHSIKLTKTLRRKNFTTDCIEETVADLVRLQYIDDHGWACQYAAQHFARDEGVQLVKSRLFRQGFDRELIDKVISETAPGEANLADSAKKQLEKWDRPSRPKDRNKRIQSAASFLMRRGFDPSICWEVVKEYFADYHEEEP